MVKYDYTVRQIRKQLLHLAKGDQADGSRDNHHEGIQGVPSKRFAGHFAFKGGLRGQGTCRMSASCIAPSSGRTLMPDGTTRGPLENLELGMGFSLGVLQQ